MPRTRVDHDRARPRTLGLKTTLMTTLPMPSTDVQPVLGDLFRLFSPFHVPAYQRAYAWQQEHVEQFLEDLREQPPEKPYYLGHFLLERADSGAICIIDGQQRLTTLTLTLGNIVRRLLALPEHRQAAEDLRKRFLGERLQMRFQTVEDDQALLECLIFDGQAAAPTRSLSQRRLVDAQHTLHRRLAKEEPETLLAWASCLGTAQVTFFLVKDKVQATQIFTFQNSRGRKLTEFEKLKAFLMQQIYLHAPEQTANQAIRRVEGHFATMYQEMERIELLDENDVLRHHDHAYSAHSGTPVDNLKKDLAAIQDKAEKLSSILRFCEALAASFVHVRALEHLAKAEERIADPLILDAPKVWPLLIKLYSWFQTDMLQRADVRDLLRHLEITLFKMDFQHGAVTNDLIYRTKHLKSKEDLPVLCRRLETAVHRGFAHNRWTFDADALEWFRRDQCYDPITRYTLWKYENTFGLDNDRKVSPWEYLNLAGKKNMQSTLEHISARNPRDGDNTEEFKARSLNNLGNLAFMPKGMNSTLSNRSEQEKQPFLRSSSYASHREVAAMIEAHGEWSPTLIQARKEKILAFIQQRWEFPEPQSVSFNG
jgi:hypothetical protein